MEQGLRIAFWMLLLVGYLHAGPINLCKMDKDEIGFELLSSVSCENVTFTSPESEVRNQCFPAALEIYRKELTMAKGSCTDTDRRIDQTLSALPKQTCFEQTACNFTMTAHKKFESFVEAATNFVDRFNSHLSRADH